MSTSKTKITKNFVYYMVESFHPFSEKHAPKIHLLL